MKCTERLNKCVSKMKWYDMSILKLCVFFFTLFLVTVWPAFNGLVISIAWYWYLIVAVILMIPLLRKMFSA
ncbi:MAG: hypothetical protein ABIA93_04935 [Candidatus Woesearchaeota archaeon]